MAPRKRALQLQKAAVETLATCKSTSTDLNGIKPEYIERIKKCYARATHQNRNEAEAQAAMRMAHRIAASLQIEIAEALQHESSEEQTKRGGCSTVKITQPHGLGRVKHEIWTSDLVAAIQTFFDCKAYSKHRPHEMVWTFYGVADHTVAAALSFEVMHALILAGSVALTGVATRSSYCQGAAHGLKGIAKEETRAVVQAAKANEEKILAEKLKKEAQAEHEKRRRFQVEIEEDEGDGGEAMIHEEKLQAGMRELETQYERGKRQRLQVQDDDDEEEDGFDGEGSQPDEHRRMEPDAELQYENDMAFQPDPFGESEDDQDPENGLDSDYNSDPEVDPTKGDFEETLQKFVKKKNPQIKEQGSQDLGSLPQWQNPQQLTVYREQSSKIAEQWLKEQQLKLRKGKSRVKNVRDCQAYRRGKEESRDIHEKSKRKRLDKANGGDRGSTKRLRLTLW